MTGETGAVYIATQTRPYRLSSPNPIAVARLPQPPRVRSDFHSQLRLAVGTMSSTTSGLDPEYLAEDISWVVITAFALILPLTVGILGLRIYTRAFILEHVGWDDYCAIFAMVRRR